MCKKSSTFASEMQAVVKNTARLFSANVVSQVVGFLVYPLLTRLYSSSDFGLLNLFVSIGGVLVLLATADYQYAIVLPKDKERVRALRQLCTMLVAGMSLLLVLSWPFGRLACCCLSAPELADWWWLMPLFVAATAGWNVLNYSYVRVSQFRRISLYMLLLSLVAAGLKVLLGWLGVEGGLLWAAVIAPWAALLAVTRWRRHAAHRRTGLDRVQVGTVAWEYVYFPFFSLPRSLTNTLALALPSIMLTPAFGLETVGLVAMAITLSFKPISLIVSSLYQVLFRETSERVNRRETILPRLRKLSLMTVAVVVPLFAALCFVLPMLTAWLLGAEWEVSGRYIRWMLPWLLFTCLNSPIAFLIDVFMAQKVGLVFEVMLLVFKAAGIGIGIWFGDVTMAVAGFSLMSAAALALQLIWFYTLVRRYEHSIAS